ncbi:UNVERIFIED_CONTAM: hypothetical protein H355_014319 [Colinus virginianus]|nr:hypothetical protein H355_014319 [Colinus virginianus]
MDSQEHRVRSVTFVLLDPGVQNHALLAPTCHRPVGRGAMSAQRVTTVSLVRNQSHVPRGISVPEAQLFQWLVQQDHITLHKGKPAASPVLKGYFCSGSGLLSPTGLCEAGFYCNGGAISPRPPRITVSGGPCPPGHYCVVGSSRAQPCPAGSYSPSWSMVQCLECPEGFYCESASTNYTDCPAGHYCPRNTKFATQYPCPPGTYSEALNIWDASKCQLCPPGRVCSKPGLARPDGLCMPGWFCPPGSMSSEPVFPGNHSDYLCPVGHYCPSGSPEPIPCPSGKYQDQAGKSQCETCPAGMFCALEDHPSNFRNSSRGVIKPMVCPAGYYCLPGTKDGHQYPCPAGTYSNKTGLRNPKECLPCPGGMFCASAGLVSPSGPCLSGYYCTSKAQGHALLATSVTLNRHGQTISSVPLAFTVLKALNPQFPAALVTSTLREESGSQQTVSSAQLDISAVVLEHILLSCALLGTSVCQVPTSVQSIHVQRVPLAPGLVPPAVLIVSPAQQACIAQHQVFHSLLDFAIRVIIVPREPLVQPLSNTGYVCLEGSSAPCPSDGVHGYRCPSGFYCPAGTELELPCEPGTFSPMPGASACLSCPAGMACSHAATAEPLSCPRGKQQYVPQNPWYAIRSVMAACTPLSVRPYQWFTPGNGVFSAG